MSKSKVEVVEAPDRDYFPTNQQSLFLAGGIVNCPDWQTDFIGLLKSKKRPLIVYNPRRKNFPIDDPNAADEQIEWEYERLKRADMISFWFSRGSLNPIVLFELGMWGLSHSSPPNKRKIFIGFDPEYIRKKDVFVQTRLARPDINICQSLESLANEINHYILRFQDIVLYEEQI